MNTFETTRLGAKPWSQAVCVFRMLDWTMNLHWLGWYSSYVFLTGLERDYSSISEAVYVGTISTCCDCIFRLCLSGVIAGGWCTNVYTDWLSWALCYLGLIHSHSSRKGVRIFWVVFGLSEMNCARGLCSVMLVRQPWLLWNTWICEPVRWYSKIHDPGKWYLKIRESGRTYLRICIFENLVCHACETIMTYIQCVNLRNCILELRNSDFRFCIDFVICMSAFSWVCDFVNLGCHVCETTMTSMQWVKLWILRKCSWRTTPRNSGFTLFETRLAGIDVFRSLSYRLHDFEQSRWFVNNKDLLKSVFSKTEFVTYFDLSSLSLVEPR